MVEVSPVTSPATLEALRRSDKGQLPYERKLKLTSGPAKLEMHSDLVALFCNLSLGSSSNSPATGQKAQVNSLLAAPDTFESSQGLRPSGSTCSQGHFRSTHHDELLFIRPEFPLSQSTGSSADVARSVQSPEHNRKRETWASSSSQIVSEDENDESSEESDLGEDSFMNHHDMFQHQLSYGTVLCEIAQTEQEIMHEQTLSKQKRAEFELVFQTAAAEAERHRKELFAQRQNCQKAHEKELEDLRRKGEEEVEAASKALARRHARYHQRLEEEKVLLVEQTEQRLAELRRQAELQEQLQQEMVLVRGRLVATAADVDKLLSRTDVSVSADKRAALKKKEDTLNICANKLDEKIAGEAQLDGVRHELSSFTSLVVDLQRDVDESREQVEALAAQEKKKAEEKEHAAVTTATAAVATPPKVLLSPQVQPSEAGSSQTGQPAAGQAEAQSPVQRSDVKCTMSWQAECDRLQKLLTEAEEKVKAFKENKEFAKYKLDLRLIVTTTINSVSAQSGSHLIQRITRLHTLLTGGGVPWRGQLVKADKHPQANLYVLMLVADLLVFQAGKQISASLLTAFPFASIAVGLWSLYPEFGEFFLAEMHRSCPVSVPHHPTRKDGQSDREFLIAQGYNFVDDNPEMRDKYLERMSGMIRLYAAVIQSSVPPVGTKTHHHNLQNGWLWLSRVLNQDPQPDLTAIAIHEFLAVAGHALKRVYGKQFDKLLHYIGKVYIPRVKKIIPKSKGGPLSRLDVLVSSALDAGGQIPPPAGYLSDQFWVKREQTSIDMFKEALKTTDNCQKPGREYY